MEHLSDCRSDFFLIQKSEDLIHDLLRRVVGEEAGEIDAVGDGLDRIKTIQSIDTAQKSRLADDSTFLYGRQRIFKVTGADQVERFGDALYFAGQSSIVNDSLVRFCNQWKLILSMSGGNYFTPQCLCDIDGSISKRTGRAADQQRIIRGQMQALKEAAPCGEIGFRNSASASQERLLSTVNTLLRGRSAYSA